MAGYRWITDKHVKSDSLAAVIQAYEWETRQVGSDTSGASRKLIVAGTNACNERKLGVELLEKVRLWQTALFSTGSTGGNRVSVIRQ